MRKLLLLVLLAMATPVHAQLTYATAGGTPGATLTLQQQILDKQAELRALQTSQAASVAPAMFEAMTQMAKASADCVAKGLESKGMFTRAAAVSKACREQAMLGAFAICTITVAQTGDTRDLNQCVAMMEDNGQYAQVGMRALSIIGTVMGVREVGAILADVVTPLALASINKDPLPPTVLTTPPAQVIQQPAAEVIILRD